MHALAMSVGLMYGVGATESVKQWVSTFNAAAKRTVIGFTQDAGPNLVLLVQGKDLDQVVLALSQSFKPKEVPFNKYVCVCSHFCVDLS